MISTPRTGKVVANTGSKVQWIAQAIEVMIPKASQFSFMSSVDRLQRYPICNSVASFS